MSVEQLSESQVVAWNSRIFIMTHVSEADLHPSSRCFGCILENAGKKKKSGWRCFVVFESSSVARRTLKAVMNTHLAPVGPS